MFEFRYRPMKMTTNETAPLIINEEKNLEENQEYIQTKTKKQIFFQYFTLFLGPILGLPFLFPILGQGTTDLCRSIFVVFLCAFYWVFEPIPNAVTSLLPLVLYPLFGLVSASEVAAIYSNDLIFLLIGTFIVTVAIEKWNLHRRIALGMLIITRGNPILILGGFLFTSYFLSMWLLNTSSKNIIY